MTKIAIITLHGQGSNKKFSHEQMVENVLDQVENKDLEFKVFPVLYYSEFQKEQDSLINRMGKISQWPFKKLKSKLISSFGDPSTIYHNRDAYKYVNDQIKEQFIQAHAWLRSGGKIVILSHSLGTVMINNYLWDAQQAGITYSRIELLITTGSPYPVFISGIKKDKIMPIDPPNENFKWFNFWNKKDILSFPLRPVNGAYYKLVDDFRVNNGFYIAAHGKYNSDSKVYKRIAKAVDKF